MGWIVPIVGLVIDCFSRVILGWHATAMVTTAQKMALWRRDHSGHIVGELLADLFGKGLRRRTIQDRYVTVTNMGR